MKAKFFTSILLIVFSATALCCQSKKQNQSTEKAQRPETAIISDSIRLCESTHPYQGGILIANFGTEQLNPLNTEDRGYIAYHKDSWTEILIPADGGLSGPKGTFVRGEHLFTCDVNKIVVYNLQALEKVL